VTLGLSIGCMLVSARSEFYTQPANQRSAIGLTPC
jgi:hypothetical protein